MTTLFEEPARMWFFPQAWQNRSDDKRRGKGTGPLVVVGAATLALAASVWVLVN